MEPLTKARVEELLKALRESDPPGLFLDQWADMTRALDMLVVMMGERDSLRKPLSLEEMLRSENAGLRDELALTQKLHLDAMKDVTRMHDRLQTTADELNGPHEVLGIDQLLDHIDKAAHEYRIRAERTSANRSRIAAAYLRKRAKDIDELDTMLTDGRPRTRGNVLINAARHIEREHDLRAYEAGELDEWMGGDNG